MELFVEHHKVDFLLFIKNNRLFFLFKCLEDVSSDISKHRTVVQRVDIILYHDETCDLQPTRMLKFFSIHTCTHTVCCRDTDMQKQWKRTVL